MMYEATVLQKTSIARDTYELILTRDPLFSFVPGQYITIVIPTADGGKTGRSYSITSQPSDSSLSLLVKLVLGGVASTYIASWQIGQKVTVVGPTGRFVLSSFKIDYLFIATGAGVAPLISMIAALLSKNRLGLFHETESIADIILLLGFRHEEDIAYEQRFRQWEKEHKNFHFILTLTRPLPDWREGTGRVTEYLLAHKEIMGDRQIYICGNGSMIRDVETICLENNIPQDHIFFEKYNNL